MWARDQGLPQGTPFSEKWLKPSAPKHERIRILTEADIFAMPDPTPLVLHMLMEKQDVAFVGEPKSGKSFIAIDLAYSIASGEPFLGELPVMRAGPVVYLSGEGHGGFKRRIKAWRLARDIPEDQKIPFYYNANVPLAAEGMDECRAYVEAIKATVGQPVLVIIDTMARALRGLDENSADAASHYLELTGGLRKELSCTTVTIAHATNKAEAKKRREIDFRGSSAFSAGFDAVWVTQKWDSNKTVTLTAKWVKKSDLDDLRKIRFRLKQVILDIGVGAVLEMVPWGHSEDPAEKDDLLEMPQKKAGAEDITLEMFIEAIREAGAYPGGPHEWHEPGGGAPYISPIECGGVAVGEVIARLYKLLSIEEPTELDYGRLQRAISRTCGDRTSGFNHFVVSDRAGGRRFAIR